MNRERLFLSGVLRATRRRRGRRRPHRPLVLAGLGLAAIGFATLADPAPRVVWNASASAPVGLYWVSDAAPKRGDLVLAEPPVEARRLAVERGYLPDGVPLVKRVAALGGDTVCAVEETVFVNGQSVAGRLAHDGRGRPLPRWTGCRMLDGDELFLLMENVPDSFDGRYFGLTRGTTVLGRLVPLWTD
ncbi:MAG: conjugative transfer signal peptidase TraF [Gammaproteobacteria bacterium]|uniref:conjugative transfer signal peptidase TraF n=1 Tax=Thalassobaculum sp. TaxID=2022740 RepID=UPI0032EB5765